GAPRGWGRIFYRHMADQVGGSGLASSRAAGRWCGGQNHDLALVADAVVVGGDQVRNVAVVGQSRGHQNEVLVQIQGSVGWSSESRRRLLLGTWPVESSWCQTQT